MYIRFLRDDAVQLSAASSVGARLRSLLRGFVLHRRRRRPHHPILSGMSFSTLKRLIEAAQTCGVLEGAQTFRARRLRLSRDQHNLPQLWSGLRQELTPTCVAVIGITGAADHWSVI
jgi:hypothetical protein